ncbi:hypothetical protein [Nocardia brasiliensis]|uniref:hypothetical protein n=1 Tax=Nocardia brasiliensis TaxID=37326 RepID=UPI0024583E8D|nr:hypothetical protein [Nocardia brasiliensis]
MTRSNTDRPDIDTEIEPPRHVSAEECAAAARTAAHHAADADELRMFLSMLGLQGGQGLPVCRKCGGPVVRLSYGGYKRATGDGMCGRCFKAAQQREVRRRAR